MRRHLRLVLNVSFNGNRPYYEDSELVRVVMGELEAVVHNEDRPRMTLLSSELTTHPDDEWDPSPEALVTAAEKVLAALEAAGVDNWEGYDEAIQSLAD